jgi:5,10-methenyltetrahydromethanopterin hydrogenase
VRWGTGTVHELKLTKAHELSQNRIDACWRDEVAMQADVIKESIGALPKLHEVDHRCQLPALVFNNVIVDVECRIRISRTEEFARSVPYKF